MNPIYELVANLIRSTKKIMSGELCINVYLIGSLKNSRFAEEVKTTRFHDFFKSIVADCNEETIAWYPIENFKVALSTLERKFVEDESNAAGPLIMLLDSFYKQAVVDNMPFAITRQ